MYPHSITHAPETSGIYKIVCSTNHMLYIGSAINLYRRWKQHYNELQRNDHGNAKLQHAWHKYGPDAFIFEVIEFILPPFLLEREQYWLDTFKPFGKTGFNIDRVAGSRLGAVLTPESRERLRISHLGNTSHLGCKHSPEALAKIGATSKGRIRTPETIEKFRAKMIGHECSPETREKMSQGRSGIKHSPEAKAKMSAAKLGKVSPNKGMEKPPGFGERMRAARVDKMKTLIVTSPDGIEYTITGLHQFCKEHGLQRQHLMECANGKVKQHKGWTARYPDVS